MCEACIANIEYNDKLPNLPKKTQTFLLSLFICLVCLTGAVAMTLAASLAQAIAKALARAIVGAVVEALVVAIAETLVVTVTGALVVAIAGVLAVAVTEAIVLDLAEERDLLIVGTVANAVDVTWGLPILAYIVINIG